MAPDLVKQPYSTPVQVPSRGTPHPTHPTRHKSSVESRDRVVFFNRLLDFPSRETPFPTRPTRTGGVANEGEAERWWADRPTSTPAQAPLASPRRARLASPRARTRAGPVHAVTSGHEPSGSHGLSPCGSANVAGTHVRFCMWARSGADGHGRATGVRRCRARLLSDGHAVRYVSVSMAMG